MQQVLAGEVTRLGYTVYETDDKAVTTRGSFADILVLNLHLRTANRVLWQIDAFGASHPKQVYKKIRSIAWENYFDVSGYFTVDTSVRNRFIRDTRYASLVVKDAVADRFQQQYGRRPDSGSEKRGAGIFLYWHDNACKVYIDTTGESLSRRGYRKNPWKAPLQETLAAGIVLSTAWDRRAPFIHPMCGSGTLAIEAALIARNIAPGSFRSDYAFKHLRQFDAGQWMATLKAAARQQTQDTPVIIATDRDAGAVDAARANALYAGVGGMITFGVRDFRRTDIPGAEGVVVINPEYGERLGSEAELEALYSAIGDFFKTDCTGHTGYIFTGNMSLAKRVGLRTSRRVPFYNGRIDCRLLEYDLYKGSKPSASG
jgi:putative N6-adenine-specific DNA methylase